MKPIKFILAILFSIAVAACGGGGGGVGGSGTPVATTLSGVAAVGSPIVNGSIIAICAAGSALSTTTSSTGTWQVTLSSTHTLPCAMQVSGGTINNAPNTTPYHSIATSTGTVNVTPLTDMLVANLTGTTTPSTWFAGLNATPATLSSITQTKVDTALTNLRDALSSGLPPLSTNNPITMTFTATSGSTGDDMLAALQSAMANTGVNYTILLSSASSPNFSTSSAVVTLSGTLSTAYSNTTSGSVPRFDVGSLTFAPQNNFTTSAAQTVKLTNTSNTGIVISGYTITLPMFAKWNVTNTNCPTAPTIFAAGASCTFSINFTPSGDDTLRNNYSLQKQLGYNPTPIPPDSYSGVLEVNSNSVTNPKVSVLLNATGVYPPDTASTGSSPSVTGINPASGPVGTVVTITGTNFNTTPASNTALFNGTQATVTAATATSLTVTVPVGATTGAVSVTTASGTATSAGTFTVSAAGSGTAAQYFNKNAVGNTWTWSQTETGLPNSTITSTITASAGGVVTFTDPSGNTAVTTDQINASGAWVSTDISGTMTMLPATFSVGTTWSMDGTINAKVVAFNVTRTVPAGTFTDCLQVNWTGTYPSGSGTTATVNFANYYSPTAGTFVDVIGTIATTGFPTATLTTQLQAGYIANATGGNGGNIPTVTGISPTSGAAGTTVTITGANFSTTPANNTVMFNGTPATVTAATGTSITVTVPSGAVTGTVSVTTISGTATSAGSFTVSTGTTTPVAAVGTQMGGARQGLPLVLTNVVTTVAGTGLVNGPFWLPLSITTDGTNLYVADTNTGKISKIVIATGVVTTLAGSGVSGTLDGIGTAASFNGLAGITTDGTNLYVSNLYTIRKIVITTGVVTTLAGSGVAGSQDGTGTSAQIYYPGSITTDGSNLYVNDNNGIRKIVIASGVVTTLWKPGLAASIEGITTDGTNLFMVDVLNSKILKMVIATKAVTIVGAATVYYSTHSQPIDLTTDGTNLYFGNQGIVQKMVIATGVVTPVAGGAALTVGTSQDGTGTAASFSGITGVTTDGINLYVSEFAKIRKIQ